MAYGIIRIDKLKTSNLIPSDKHTQRARFTPNADPDKPHLCLIGTPEADLPALVRGRIGKQTIRKNAVWAVEMLCSASAEYFRPTDPSKWGYWEDEKLDAFVATVIKWLEESWGDRIVRAQLHLDEGTPHIHAYLVPLDEKGNLNCRGLFGTRSKLSKLQDSYAEAMQALGLERGIKGSLATHTQIQKYYTATNQAPDLSLDTETIHHQLADRGRILKENREIKKTAKSLSKMLEQKEYKIVELETGVDALQQKLQYWQDKDQQRQKHLKSVQIPIIKEVLQALGAVPIAIDAKGELWQIGNCIIKITDTGFSMPNSGVTREGNNPLEIVMALEQCSFEDALVWCNEYCGEDITNQIVQEHTRAIIQNKPVHKFSPPPADNNYWQSKRNELVEQGISGQILDKLHHEGLVYTDAHGNLVCPCHSLSSDEIMGAILTSTLAQSERFTSFAHGSKRREAMFHFVIGADTTGNTSNPITTNANQLPAKGVLVSTPLDALAKASLDAHEPTHAPTMYIALNPRNVPFEILRLMPKDSIEIALNRDADSQKLAHQIRQQLPKQTLFKRPTSDWVTALQTAHAQKQQQIESHPHLSSELKPNLRIRR
jgi:Plasmid recombination enzyme